MRLFLLILFLSKLILFLSLICEDIKRPKKKEDCFERTFVGEFNEQNAYCCFLYFLKNDWKIFKCSVHLKEEIDNNAVLKTINFLKKMNNQSGSPNEIRDILLDCKHNYLTNINITILLLIILIFF